MNRTIGRLVAVSFLSGARVFAGSSEFYVDVHAPGPIHDGLSWCTAFQDLQEAIDASAEFAVIRVAEGTYRPSTDGLNDPREATFRLRNELTLFGGYEGCNGINGSRVPSRNLTILSGDLTGNDTGAADHPSHSENAYHVVTSISNNDSAVLNGFFVVGGNANGASLLHSQGGGIHIENGSPRILSTVISGNFAANAGGGIFAAASMTVLPQCQFNDNITTGRGGGFYGTGAVTLEFPVLRNNRASQGGGAYFANPSPTTRINRGALTSNRAMNGGGLYLLGGAAMLQDTAISSNEAMGDPIVSAGGGIYANGCDLTVISGFISANQAVGGFGFARGGGVFVLGGSLIAENAGLGGNQALGSFGDGGAMYSDGGRFELFNCILIGNYADYDGGTIHLQSQSMARLENCTLLDNQAGRRGAGAYLIGASSLTILHSIFRHNVDNQANIERAQVRVDAGTLAIDYTCLEGWSGMLGGLGNFGDNPRFLSGIAGCTYLSHEATGQMADSPCVDAGSSTAEDVGLHTRTTRGDEVVDSGPVDLGYHFIVTHQPWTLGDTDRDARLSLRDYRRLQVCFDPATPANCSCRGGDLDLDETVGLSDHQEFIRRAVGP